MITRLCVYEILYGIKFWSNKAHTSLLIKLMRHMRLRKERHIRAVCNHVLYIYILKQWTIYVCLESSWQLTLTRESVGETRFKNSCATNKKLYHVSCVRTMDSVVLAQIKVMTRFANSRTITRRACHVELLQEKKNKISYKDKNYRDSKDSYIYGHH